MLFLGMQKSAQRSAAVQDLIIAATGCIAYAKCWQKLWSSPVIPPDLTPAGQLTSAGGNLHKVSFSADSQYLQHKTIMTGPDQRPKWRRSKSVTGVGSNPRPFGLAP